MHPNKKELSALSQSLQIVLEEAEQLPAEMGAIRVRVTTRLRQEINFINSIAGIAASPTVAAVSPELTHIMGEEIIRHKPVDAVDLQPTSQEKEKFLTERDNLYSQFLKLKNDQIYSKAKQPGGPAVIRAVAKKAGIENYANAKINDVFIGAIRKKIQAEVDTAEALRDADEAVKNA